MRKLRLETGCTKPERLYKHHACTCIHFSLLPPPKVYQILIQTCVSLFLLSLLELDPSSVQLPGCRTKSLVWEYFKYDRVLDKSICQTQKSPTTLTVIVCVERVAGKNPTNLKQHLRTDHPQVINDIERKEDMKKIKDRKKREETLKHYQQSTQSFTKK